MKQIFVAVTLLIGIGSIFYIFQKQPQNTTTLPVIDKTNNVNNQELIKPNLVSPNVKATNKTSTVVNSTSVENTPQIQTNLNAMPENSAAQFDKLPQKMQKQIKELSGRNNPNIQPVEVEPGVFLIPAGKGVNVVPVAVVNEDGTVSTHEY